MTPGATQYITPRVLLAQGLRLLNYLFNYRAEQLPVSKRAITKIYFGDSVSIYALGHAGETSVEVSTCQTNPVTK